MPVIGEAIVKFTSDATGTIRALQQVGDKAAVVGRNSADSAARTTRAFNQISSALGLTRQNFAKATEVASTFSTTVLAVGSALSALSVRDFSNLNEAVNAANVTFGDASQTLMNFAQTAATAVGLSKRAFLEASTPVGAALQNVGMSAQEAAGWTIDLTQRAADMASVFNTSVNDALMAIQAGLRGEIDPLERFGVGLSETAVQSYAVAKGIAASRQELSMQQKIVARLGLLMEQTDRVQGDFANTSDGLANKQRILKARLEDSSAAIGQRFAPFFDIAIDLLARFSQLTPEAANQVFALGGAVLTVIAAFAGLVGALKVAVLFLNPVMLIFAAIAAIVGVVAYKAFQNFQKKVGDTAKSTNTATGSVATTGSKNLSKLGDAAGETAERIADIERAIKKTRANFLQDLADMVRAHQDKVKDIKTQISEEERSYQTEQADLASDYKNRYDEITASHADKVRAIQNQIDTETAKGTQANQLLLQGLRERLTKETAEYTAATAKEKAEYDARTAKATAEYEKRQSALKASLAEEEAILAQHEQDVALVKDVGRKTDIQRLKENYAEQAAQYQRDLEEARRSAASKASAFQASDRSVLGSAQGTASGIATAFNDIAKNINTGAFATIGQVIGSDMGKALLSAFKEALIELVTLTGQYSDKILNKVTFGLGDFADRLGRFTGNLSNYLGGKTSTIPKFADGVRNFSGGLAIVGERGPELVNLPKGADVFSNLESRQMASAAGATGGVTVTVNLGTFLGTPGEFRAFSERIGREIERVSVAAGGL